MIDQSIQIQKILIDYFKDFDDETMIKVIDSFVYDEPTTDEKISKIIEKFLADNSLTQAWCNIMLDKKEPTRFFTRSNMSEVEIINQIKNGFLNLAYNRFRCSSIELKLAKNETDTTKRYLKIANLEKEIAINELKIDKLNKFEINATSDVKIQTNKKTSKQKKSNLIDPKKVKFRFDNDDKAEVHITTILNDDYTLCGILIDGDYTHDIELDSTEKITCQHCLDVIKQCKTAKI